MGSRRSSKSQGQQKRAATARMEVYLLGRIVQQDAASPVSPCSFRAATKESTLTTNQSAPLLQGVHQRGGEFMLSAHYLNPPNCWWLGFFFFWFIVRASPSHQCLVTTNPAASSDSFLSFTAPPHSLHPSLCLLWEAVGFGQCLSDVPTCPWPSSSAADVCTWISNRGVTLCAG